MEVAILGGLVGLGYLFNENNKNNDHVNTLVDNKASVPNGDNLYNSEHYQEVDKVIQNLAQSNFEASYDEGSNVINNQKLDRIGSDLYSKSLNENLLILKD